MAVNCSVICDACLEVLQVRLLKSSQCIGCS